jgi:hypothetical protein
VPADDRIPRDDHAQGLAVAVADKTPADEARQRSPYEPLQREPPGVVEGHDELGSTERLVQPGAVGGVENPLRTLADRMDSTALLLSRNRDPARLPRKVIHRVPWDTCNGRQARSQS